MVENRVPGSEDLMEVLSVASPKGAVRIGFTGPPGVGKSTLVREVARALAERDANVGILAVDPSSPRSGGALLGDRIRMTGLEDFPATFVRSMASGGISGGLAPAAREILDLLEGFGFSHLIVETVGSGQAEVEVSRSTDTVVLVVMPGQGDAVQAMKAGILEIADIVVVNKSDLQGAEEAVVMLREGLALFGRAGDAWNPPVLPVCAESGRGVVALMESLADHRESLERSGDLETRRSDRFRARIGDILRREALEAVERIMAPGVLDEAELRGAREGRETPQALARRLAGRQ